MQHHEIWEMAGATLRAFRFCEGGDDLQVFEGLPPETRRMPQRGLPLRGRGLVVGRRRLPEEAQLRRDLLRSKRVPDGGRSSHGLR